MTNENMDSGYHNREGIQFYRNRMFEKAIESFSNALNLLPSLENSSEEQIQLRQRILSNRANSYYNAGTNSRENPHFIDYYNSAIEDYSAAIKLTKDNEEIGSCLFSTAIIKYLLLKFDEANNIIHKAIELKTKNLEKYQKVMACMLNDILDNDFSNRKDIIEFPMPSTIKTIGKESFSGCENLKNIDLPSGLNSMGERAFDFCKSLEQIIIPGSLKEIPFCAFQGCINLKKIEISDGVEVIGENAFHSGSYENVILPDSVKKVKNGGFFSNTVKNIKIGSKVSLGKDAFCYNFALDYKLQGKKAGTYVLKPEGLLKEINGEQVELNWVASD